MTKFLTETTKWLADQKNQKRQLVLIINPLAKPNPVPILFAKAPIRDYARLFQGTEFETLAAEGPWLVRIDSSTMKALSELISRPELNWGWVASAENLDINEVVEHWRARMVVHHNGQRAFYRFEDNRVIARHLLALDQAQIPLLLGPLISALIWDGQHWIEVENLRPAAYPEPFDKPWLSVPEPQSTEIQLELLQSWLCENHLKATQQLAVKQPIRLWIQANMEKAKHWGWTDINQLHFLLEHQLIPNLEHHGAWAPVSHESPHAHYMRCQREFVNVTSGART